MRGIDNVELYVDPYKAANSPGRVDTVDPEQYPSLRARGTALLVCHEYRITTPCGEVIKEVHLKKGIH